MVNFLQMITSKKIIWFTAFCYLMESKYKAYATK